MSGHPELESEQAYLDRAYACIEEMRSSARQLQHSIDTGPGGTFQARFERDVTVDTALTRLHRLELGTESLCFGRIDRSGGERFYVGRMAVSDREQNPVIVDWRAPVAEAFYRATGRSPMGLVRRRHFATSGPTLLGIDDEVFSIDALESDDGGLGLVGTGALLAALGRARSGQMRDIVGTIQAEQDEIIRSELPGVLVVQGGPGTGKTAVALHRAAYLLYTHRFPLERQGVLVVGPNRLFMRYIARVLPALGETGVMLANIDQLYPVGAVQFVDSQHTRRVKGDVRMAKVLKRAVATRERALKEDLHVGVGVATLTLTVAESAELVNQAKRQHRLHNPTRRHLQHLVAERLHLRYIERMNRLGRSTESGGVLDLEAFSTLLRREESYRVAIDRMWPWLTPQMFLRDLFGAPALIRAASRDLLSDDDQKALVRPRGESLESYQWSSADVALLDEASTLLGPLDGIAVPAGVPGGGVGNGHVSIDPATGFGGHDDPNRTFGHIVVDEAQDLSPMQLRMLTRRSLSGSMTIVGDIGQATGMWAPSSWDEVLAHLPKRRNARRVELTVGYRTPAEIMALAARVLAVAAPDLTVPTSVRSVGDGPLIIAASAGETLAELSVRAVERVARLVGEGTIGVLVPDDALETVKEGLVAGGLPVDVATTRDTGIELGLSVLPVSVAKGLEFDGVVVVEPGRIVSEAPQGLRALYVAMTRATRALAVAHVEPLPACLAPPNDVSYGEPNNPAVAVAPSTR